ncbi:PAS domain-containing protein [bacterium]|nr:PAS domain-containing protein [bacterium]
MTRRRLLWQIYPYYFAVILASLAAAAWYATREMEDLYLSETRQTLETRATVLIEQFLPLLETPDPAVVDSLAKRLGLLSDTRVTVMDTNGVVLGDSEQDPALMENHGRRPEMLQALNDSVGAETRFSNTLQMRLMYVAVPIERNGTVIGVIRTSHSLSDVEASLSRLYQRLTTAAVVVLLLATIITFLIFSRLTRPLEDLREGAERLAAGKLDTRLPIPDTLEIADVADSMNHMAVQLEARLRTTIEQRNEREAILASMSEGVVAVDLKDRIVTINRAACEMARVEADQAIGQPILGVVRVPVLHDLIGRASVSDTVVTGDITLTGDQERYIRVHAAALRDSYGTRIGLVIVFNDVTTLRKLERTRRDFVANVSHELKTPITAITGYAETLLEDEEEVSADVKRFLSIILKHATRLNALVDDLLALARVENDSERGGLEFSRQNLRDILDQAIESRQELAEKKNVKITLECEPDLEWDLLPQRLEQAVGNLLENAIKHGDTVTEITVRAEVNDDELRICVCDNGVGIEPRHLPRLFERFYRIDASRSSTTGGTGLGLALVKHIAQAHGGQASVESTPGSGCTFRIHLPRESKQD